MSPWKIHITIVVNNPAVLLSPKKPHLQGGQALITVITEEINQLEMGAKVNLWPQGEEDKEHTARTHSLAREATVESSEVNAPPWARIQLRALELRWARANANQHQKDNFRQSTTGQFTHQLDSALPVSHTRMLYDCLNREKASVLA
jgi:hypothetical protein